MKGKKNGSFLPPIPLLMKDDQRMGWRLMISDPPGAKRQGLCSPAFALVNCSLSIQKATFLRIILDNRLSPNL